ncbi:MAG: AAA-associated domain-containing protein [Terrimicrobiaceae bacterium]
MSVALAIHTIPQANISEVVGLASVVTPEARNIFDLGDELGYEFSNLLVVIKSAELLDLVTTPGENVMLTETWRQFLAADVSRRREILREKMLGLPLFNRLVRLIEEAPDRLISIVDLFEHLKELVSKRKISRNSRGPSSDGTIFGIVRLFKRRDQPARIKARH